MANYEVKVKRPPGRPRTEPCDIKYAKKKAQNDAQRANPNSMLNMEKRKEKNIQAKLDYLGPRVCAATGETENVECHHRKPSAVNRKNHRDILNETASTASVKSIHRELKAGDCVWLVKRLNMEVEHRLRKEMADFDDQTQWSSESARNAVKDWVCGNITRHIIIREQIKRMMD